MLQTRAVDISTTILTVLVAFAPTTQAARVTAGPDFFLKPLVLHI
jgi:hypothetical protein